VIGYEPGIVAALSVSWAVPDLVVSAADVAVIVTLAGKPLAMVGAVYKPLALMVPPLEGVTAQVTAVLVAFVTVAVNCAV
jgi:hypothetical protein